jgi:hypothetical protein
MVCFVEPDRTGHFSRNAFVCAVGFCMRISGEIKCQSAPAVELDPARIRNLGHGEYGADHPDVPPAAPGSGA